MQSATILLARHGETDWNVERRFQGHADQPLNRFGRRQARALAALMRDQPLVAIYSSDLLRARVTAEIVGETVGLTVEVRPGLREIDVGEFRGLTYPEIVARWPEVPERTERIGYGWLEGESYEQLRDRVFEELHDIAARHPKSHVLVVGHGAMIRVVLAATAGMDIVSHRDVVGPIGNCAVHRLELDVAATGSTPAG